MAASHGWSLDGIGLFELESLEERLQAEQQYTVFHPSEVELGETTRHICEQVEKLNPSLVVFDSLSEMRLLARDPLRYRRQVLALKQFFAGRKCTVMLLDDRTSRETDLQLQSICHGVIVLERMAVEYGGARRRLSVSKMRGLQFREGYHDFTIEPGGLVVYPRLVAAEHKQRRAGQASHDRARSAQERHCGIGSAAGRRPALTEPAHWRWVPRDRASRHWCRSTRWRWRKAGERVACYVFEETQQNYLDRAAGLGMDLRPHIESGRVTVDQIDPAEISPGEFANRVQTAVESGNGKDAVRVVIIDSLNGYLNSMPSESFLLIQMHELLMYLNERGVLTLMVLAQHGLVGAAMQTPVDVTYLADTVIVLRYFEAFGEVRQAHRGRQEALREVTSGASGSFGCRAKGSRSAGRSRISREC